jgi:serine/threonine-protein kinase HipA
MTCGACNRYANRASLLSQHGQFKLSFEHATTADCAKLAGAFNYAGFELDPPVVLVGR